MISQKIKWKISGAMCWNFNVAIVAKMICVQFCMIEKLSSIYRLMTALHLDYFRQNFCCVDGWQFYSNDYKTTKTI